MRSDSVKKMSAYADLNHAPVSRMFDLKIIHRDSAYAESLFFIFTLYQCIPMQYNTKIQGFKADMSFMLA